MPELVQMLWNGFVPQIAIEWKCGRENTFIF